MLTTARDTYIPVYDPNPPSPSISKITRYGEVTIKFNTTLVQYNDYDVENNSTYASNRMFFGRDEDSTYGQPIIGFANYTLIHNSTVMLDGRVYPAMEVLLKPIIKQGNMCAD